MLTVGRRDEGRKGLGMGFGEEGGMEEENELEEGEACLGEEDNALVDPDVALSYIDDKLQDVLGHFQKEFEAGVSAENLGSKFGGYGSFLPAYQRSPSIWSQPKSPPMALSHNGSRSPNNQPEGARRDAPLQTSASIVTNNTVTVGQASDSSCKKDRTSVRESVSQHDSVSKLVNGNEQKTFKVRIKVGPESVSTRNNAAIYSGLGLDISPSSSLDDSPDGSEGLPPEQREAPDESPMTIIEIMTCFSLPGGYLLSPLPDSMLYLTEKERSFLKSCKRGKLNMDVSGTCTVLEDLTPGKIVSKGRAQKKVKSVEKNEKNGKLQDAKKSTYKDEISSNLKREIDIQTPASQDLVSSALNIPHISHSLVPDIKEARTSFSESAKDNRIDDSSGDQDKTYVKGLIPTTEPAKENQLQMMETIKGTGADSAVSEMVRINGKVNSRTRRTEKTPDEKNRSAHKDASSDFQKEGRIKVGNHKIIGREHSVTCNTRNDHIAGPAEDMKTKSAQKFTFKEDDGENELQRKGHFSEGDEKMHESQVNGMQILEFNKENPKIDAAATSKEKKKSSHARGEHSEKKAKSLKFNEKSGRGLPKHSCGDLDDSKAELLTNGSDVHFVNKQKDVRLEIFKESSISIDKSKERPVGKKGDNALGTQVVDPQFTTTSACNIPGSQVVVAPSAPVLIEENWVCCDKCQIWRLLPYGKNPDLLPKKWLCNMQTWLPPGMNRCNLSEEETTKALHALYQIPVSDANLTGYHGVVATYPTSADAQHLTDGLEPNMQNAPAVGKKKHGSKDASNTPKNVASFQTSNSGSKNQMASSKCRSLNDVNQHPLESNSLTKGGLEFTSKSIDFASEKHKSRQKEKYKNLGCSSDEADYLERGGKHPKSKGKREVDQDGLRLSKKVKTEGLRRNEDWHSEYEVAGKVTSVVDNFFPSNVNGGKAQKHNGHLSSKDMTGDMKGNLPASHITSEALVQNFTVAEFKDHASASEMEKFDRFDASAKKRKLEWQENQGHQISPLANQPLVDRRADVKEAFSESEWRKEKKPKVSKSERKESKTSNASVKMDKKTRMTRIVLSGVRQSLNDEMEETRGPAGKENRLVQYRENANCKEDLGGSDSLKKDFGYGQPSTAANSSSSKVSGSHKSRANFQDGRCSPVESVSSSPMRSSNRNKHNSTRNLGSKNENTNAVFSVMDSPKGYSEGEVDGQRNRCRIIKKENASSLQQKSSEGLRAVERSILDSLRGPYHYEDKEVNPLSGNKAKDQMHLQIFGDTSPIELQQPNATNGIGNTLDQHCDYGPSDEDHHHDLDKLHNNHLANGFDHWEMNKNSSSQVLERNKSSKSGLEKGNLEVDNSFSEHEFCPANNGRIANKNALDEEHRDLMKHCEDHRDEHYMYLEETENDYVHKKDLLVRGPCVDRRDDRSSHGLEGKLDVHGLHLLDKHGKEIKMKVAAKDCVVGKSTKQENSKLVCFNEEKDRADCSELASGRGKAPSGLPSRNKEETSRRGSQVLPTAKGSKPEVCIVNTANGDASKVMQSRKPDNQNAAPQNSLRQATPNGPDAPSPIRRDSHSAANVLKEARDLKHTANRLKNEGLELESTGLYFQAALKFLHYASLLEPLGVETARHGEANKSMQMYSDTARLCEFCAHEYERCKEMAAAALAYKCVEVAYLKVTYFKHSSASVDRQELQTALQMVFPGESPSSSASDVDNLNNQGALDKAVSAKGVSSPQVAGSHVIAARHRPNFMRLLNYTNETVCAFDASRKYRIAIAAADAHAEKDRAGRLSSVKKVLDFNFHNIERLLHLVRVSMEVISH